MVVLLRRPRRGVSAVPDLGFNLCRFPGGSVFLRGRLDLFPAEPLPEAVGGSAAHRVGGLLVFGFEFFGEVILGVRPVFLCEGGVDRLGRGP